MTMHFYGRNRDVTVVLNIAVSLCQCVVLEEGFESKYKHYFTWKMAEKFACYSVGIIILLFCCLLSKRQVVTFHKEIKNCRHYIFLDYKLMKVTCGSQQSFLSQ